MPNLVALTQRLCSIEATGEQRDSLDRAWGIFLAALGCRWIALPNQPEYAVSLATQLGVDALILTGGEDWGDNPLRDQTEMALLDWASIAGFPVAGVCRGMQVMGRWLSGTLAPVDAGLHRATRHPVRFVDGSTREVNSYHNFGLERLPHGLRELATCPRDGRLEAVAGKKLLGIQWHPEREPKPDPADIRLFHQLFAGNI
jgi:putative glutamine amidotransferase